MQHLSVSRLKQTKQWAILQFYDDFIVAFSKQTQFRIINQKTQCFLLLLFCRCLPFSSALRQIPTKKIMSFLFKFVLFTQSLFFCFASSCMILLQSILWRNEDGPLGKDLIQSGTQIGWRQILSLKSKCNLFRFC